MAESSAPASRTDLLCTLQTRFGHAGFRPGQAEAIDALLTGRDALVVMPTGAGKSLVYQLASLHLPGTTLVVSPLIALMQDQVAALDRFGLSATFINSSLTATEQQARMGQMTAGHFDLVYVSPERLRYEHFTQALGQTRVSLLAVDEAHCISQWGHDFRPDYRRIAQTARALGGPTTLAATATATPRVQQDIIDCLGLRTPFCMMTGYDRPNLRLAVCRAEADEIRFEQLGELLRRHSSRNPTRAVIVYCGTREGAETASAFANEVCGLHASFYHAGLPDRTRLARLQAFTDGDLDIIAATNAFGMGIDRPDVGLVVHFGIPGTLEAYYQEAGRAGRDGQPSEAVLLYAPSDRSLQEWFIANDRLERGNLRAIFDGIQRLGVGQSDSAVRSTAARLSRECHLPESSLRVGLDLLEQAGIVERPGDHGYTIAVVLRDWDEGVIADLESRYEEHHTHRYAALETMISYAEKRTCRRHAILAYFGDARRPVHDRCCDNCDAQKLRTVSRLAQSAQADDAGSVSQTESPVRPWESDGARETKTERGIVHPGAPQTAGNAVRRDLKSARMTILRALQVGRWPVGRDRLVTILQGGHRKDFEAKGYYQNPYYGALRSKSTESLRQEIDAMVADGLLTRTGGYRPVLKLTATGRALAASDTHAGGPSSVSTPPIDRGTRPAASDGMSSETQKQAGPRNAPTSDLLTTKEVIERLRDPRQQVRRLAVRALEARRDPATAEPLLAFMNEQQTPDLMLAAVRALQQIGAAAARSALELVAGNQAHKEYVRHAARQALHSVGVQPDSSSVIESQDGAQQAETVTRTARQDEIEGIHLAARIEAFLNRPHYQLLQGPWDLGWALDHHGRHQDGRYSHTAIGRAVEQLKYHQRATALGPIREALRSLPASAPELFRVDVIVPVPSTETRAIDPVTVLAGIAADLTGLPVERLLVKTRATHPQKDLHTLAEKRRNVRDAFGVGGAVRGRAVLVIDDLCDSGETLKEVTGVLRRAGATRVHVLTATRTSHTEG